MESIEPGEEPEKVQAVSTSDLVAEKQRIIDHNQKNEKVRGDHRDLLVRKHSSEITVSGCNEELISMREADARQLSLSDSAY